MRVHTLDTRLTLHTLPLIALNDRNHLGCEIQARRMSCQSHATLHYNEVNLHQ